ncbi:unnamed protein product [Nippostrongylus brasiliensis]|uniref:LD31742p (inferred by orthology to a D. melanogaster protein) n=1 Tax=Nippostrongylus brasiliensis TaxID=27835 RepID=A0A0N4YCE9_NIPBR|nr:unnamed protein product [Nippostrongylus brasiliensis]
MKWTTFTHSLAIETRGVRNFCFRVPNSGFRPFLALPFRFVFRLAYLDNSLWPIRPAYFLAGAVTIGAVQVKLQPSILTLHLPVFTNQVAELCRGLVSWSTPKLRSCDGLLPSPTVPKLEDTVARYLKSIKKLVDKDQYEQIKEQADGFLKNEGPRLQMYAWLMSLTQSNYITPEPLLVNSSVAHTDLLEVPEHRRATRAYMAARVTYFEGMSQLAVDRQDIKPLGGGMLCSSHYDKLYSVCRVPGEQIDELVNYGISKHVVVIAGGCFYKVMLCDDRNSMYSIDQLASIYAEIISRDEKETGAAGKVAALTADRRDEWARNRRKFFLENPINAATLREIESAAFIIVLDESEYTYDPCGGTTEHSIGDGAEFDHIMEDFVAMELLTRYPSIEDQQKNERLYETDHQLTLATRLPVEVNPEMADAIERCYNQHNKARDDVDLASLMFRDFGKGKIKKCGLSPDGFVQMAIQLANYQDQGRFVLTYEAASARFFKNSRTETLRSVTDESCDFVLAMLDEKVSKEEKIEKLRKACSVHTVNNKEAMVGRGVDRHLFVLYVLAQGTSVSSPFLDHYISQPWLLSTSHVPNVTNQIDEDSEVWRTWSGASFGAVAKNGYDIIEKLIHTQQLKAVGVGLAMVDGDIVAKWSVPLQDKEVLRRDWMFKLVGKESFQIGKMKCTISVEALGTFAYEYSLQVNGKNYETFREEQSKKLICWETHIGGEETRIVLDKETMEVWVNGSRIDTAGEFVADGTETHFEVGHHVCKIRAASSGRKKIGVVHELYVNGEPIPQMTFSKTR